MMAGGCRQSRFVPSPPTRSKIPVQVADITLQHGIVVPNKLDLYSTTCRSGSRPNRHFYPLATRDQGTWQPLLLSEFAPRTAR